MADESGLLCNSTKNHLQLTLDQPTKYNDDIEAGGTFPDNEEQPLEEAEEKDEEEEDKNDKISSKVPPLYQVEPGCTPLSCYSAIITFWIMVAGILWLLLTSPPKTSVPFPMPAAGKEQAQLNQVYDLVDSYEDDFSSSTTVSPPTTIKLLKILSTTTKETIPALEVVLDDSGP